MSRVLLVVVAVIAIASMVSAQGLKPIEVEKSESDNQRDLYSMVNGTLVLTASICSNPNAWLGQVVCDASGGYCGECVSFVKRCTGDTRTTSKWVQGIKVRGNSGGIRVGTAIATFPDGKYYGHAAIYQGQTNLGIQVVDQWKGHPVAPRTLTWGGTLSNDGDKFYVIN